MRSHVRKCTTIALLITLLLPALSPVFAHPSTIWPAANSYKLSAISHQLAAHPSPPAYWQQDVHYNINVSLNDTNHTLRCTETLEYTNHSPDTLSFIWFHIWPNAYKDNTTALYKQLSRLEERKEKLKKIRDNGYIDHLAFTVDGTPARTQPHPEYNDVIRLLLPKPLLPGQQISIATPFFVKIPSYFSRLGHEGQAYMITQWYPKPAVYDHKGWHEMPYLDQGEFYSEFGSFDVHIRLPSSYVVGATGQLQSPEELAVYKTIGQHNRASDTSLTNPPQFYHAVTPSAFKTLDYHADHVHDFAWFADKNFIVNYDTLQLASGRIIDVFSWYRPNNSNNKQWRHSISFIKDAVIHYSNWIGEYGYPVVNAVEGPGNVSSGGMEYPMITLITSPKAGKEELDGVIAHEIGHNWFYAMLGTNERDHPWMDEGINTFYEFRYEAEKYRYNTMIGAFMPEEFASLSPDKFEDAIYNVLNQMRSPEPIETPAVAFPSEFDYGIVVYARTAIWMHILEKSIGRELFAKGMQTWFSDWQYKHPYPEDLKASLEKVTGASLDKLFALLNKGGPL